MGALAQIQAENAEMRAALNAVREHEVLRVEMAARGLTAPVTMASITRLVAAKHGLTVDQLKSRSSRHDIAHPRQEAMWQMRQEKRSTGAHRWSLTRIGAFFGLDHTSVLSGVRAHERRMAGGLRS